MAATTTVPPPSTTPTDSDVAGKIVGLDYDDDHVLLAPALRFAVTSRPYGAGTSQKDTDDSRRLIAAVDAALALRLLRGGDVDELEINFVYGSPWNMFLYGPSGSGHYICRHGHAGDITSEHVASWLPASARAEAMSLTLAYASLAVPAAGAGAFNALIDLTLTHVRIEPGGADERNLSSLC
ncbi:hypothetical protein EJB05_01363, partial [Eragrostis curvula]